MLIALQPVRMDASLTLHVSGDVLSINGVPYDFGPLPNGAILPKAAVDCSFLASDVLRRDGRIELTLILPHGPCAPPETRFPSPVETTNGPVTLPPFGDADDHPEH